LNRAPWPVLKEAIDASFPAEGDRYTIPLFKGMDDDELLAFQEKYQALLPESSIELLQHCRGFDHAELNEVRFDRLADKGLGDFLFKPMLIAQNEEGLSWLLNISPASGDWGKIYVLDKRHHACALQAENLATFFDQLFHAAGHSINWLNHIQHKVIPSLRKDSPPGIGVLEASHQGDDSLRRVARHLPKNARIFDMRYARPGDGFSWGESHIQATAEHDIFAILPIKKPRWKWLPFFK
jgi:hypothetical protein